MLAASLAACNRKPLDLERARSSVRSARSYAAESELLVDSTLQGLIPPRYAERHVRYLSEMIAGSEKELQQSQPRPEAAGLIQKCVTQLPRIAAALSAVRAAVGRDDRPTLSTAREQLDDIRANLEYLDQTP